MIEKTVEPVGSNGKLKFIIGALVGAFLFLAPIPVSEYSEAAGEYITAFNIPLGLVIAWLNGVLNFGELPTEDIRLWLAYLFIIVAFLGTLLTYVVKPKFIMESPKLKDIFYTSPLYAVTRVLAVIIMTLVIFEIEPTFYVGNEFVGTADLGVALVDRWDGAGLMVFDLITGLTTIFLVLSFATPLLTDFGLMEFIGIIIKKFVNALFLLPGRAAVDLAASWLGSSAVAVIITSDQHEKGYYTGREAATICANFALVSVPFSLIIATTVGVEAHFATWYLIVAITCILLGIIMPRVWPLRHLPDTYPEGVTKQLDEEVEEGGSRFQVAVARASARAAKATLPDFMKNGFNGWLTAFMDLFPVIVAWGTIAIVINAVTPIFDWIAWPFGQMLELLNVAGGATYAPVTVVGFIDMFLPAIIMGSETYLETRFILSALSIVQIIYMAETGVLILKSKMPVGMGKLIVLFFMRTVIALPIIVGLTRLLMNFS